MSNYYREFGIDEYPLGQYNMPGSPMKAVSIPNPANPMESPALKAVASGLVLPFYAPFGVAKGAYDIAKRLPEVMYRPQANLETGEIGYDPNLAFDLAGMGTASGAKASMPKLMPGEVSVGLFGGLRGAKGKTLSLIEEGGKAASTSPDLLPTIRSLQQPGQERELVSISKLREQSGVDQKSFDTQLIQLAKDGLISLHKHDFPYSLKPEARAKLLVLDDPNEFKGKAYYIGVAPTGKGNDLLLKKRPK